MQLVTLGPDGLAIAVTPVPADMHATADDGPVSQGGHRLALVNGAIARVWDLRGYSCFTGASGRVPGFVPNDPGMVGKSWTDLAELGFLQNARPETEAEQEAREQAAEAARIANLEVARYAALVALLSAGITEAMIAEQLAEISNPTERETSRLYFNRPTWRRTSAFISWGKGAFNLTDQQVDALFVAADGID